MKLIYPDYVILIVENLERSLVFYTQVLGLPLAHRAEEYAQLDTGPTRMGLYTRGAMEKTLGKDLRVPDPEAPGFEIGFKVPDVDAAYQEVIRRGADSLTPPTDRPWGQRTSYVRDPDGYLIELAQQMDERERLV